MYISYQLLTFPVSSMSAIADRKPITFKELPINAQNLLEIALKLSEESIVYNSGAAQYHKRLLWILLRTGEPRRKQLFPPLPAPTIHRYRDLMMIFHKPQLGS